MKGMHLLAALVAAGLLVGCDKDGDGQAGAEVKVDAKVDGKTEGQVIDDEALTKSVEKALKNSEAFKFPDVVVVVNKGEVQLSGFVADRGQKDAAGDMAKRVAGVRNVDNKIEVKK